jgi:hypothetical protein
VGAGGHHVQGQGSSDSLLQVEPGAVPALRNAFADALARVDRQLELADTELRVAPWANDPVSAGATTVFNERSVDDAASALDTLRAYRRQLSNAVDRLDQTAEQYRLAEQDNSVTVGTEGQGR